MPSTEAIVWPLRDLVLRTPALVLRPMTEQDAFALAAVVPPDLEHDPRLPEVSGAQKVLLSYWRYLGHWRPEDWALPFAVLLDGTPVGQQVLEGTDFAVRRTVDSASWLVRSVRGRGLGRQMRAAVLALAFDQLAAAWAVTEAWEDNAASLAVSRSLGYVDNGVDLHARDGRPARMQRLLLARRDWSSPVPVDVSGFEPGRSLFGL